MILTKRRKVIFSAILNCLFTSENRFIIKSARRGIRNRKIIYVKFYITEGMDKYDRLLIERILTAEYKLFSKKKVDIEDFTKFAGISEVQEYWTNMRETLKGYEYAIKNLENVGADLKLLAKII